MKWKWFIDVSHWDLISDEQYLDLIAHGMCGVSIKSSQHNWEDSKCALHVAQAKKFGVPIMLFHWVDPIFSIQPQLDKLVSLIEKYEPASACGDYEQYWTSWEQWEEVVVKKTQPGPLNRFSQDRLLKSFGAFVRGLKSYCEEKSLTHVGYSGFNFLNEYCRPLATILKQNTMYWHAAYFSYPKQLDSDPLISWAEFRNYINSLVPPDNRLGFGMNQNDWSMWQVHDKIILPNLPRMDHNIIKDSAYVQVFGKPPVIIPPVIDPPEVLPIGKTQMVVTSDTLNQRTSPKVLKTNDIGDFQNGAIVNVLNIVGTDAWIEYAPGKFCCAQKGSERYLEPVKPKS